MHERSGIEGFPRSDADKAAGQPGALDAQAARRLPGEDLDSRYPEDAEHWAAVYGELEGFIEQLLAQTGADTLNGPGAEYLEDQEALLSELERIRARRGYWEQCQTPVDLMVTGGHG